MKHSRLETLQNNRKTNSIIFSICIPLIIFTWVFISFKYKLVLWPINVACVGMLIFGIILNIQRYLEFSALQTTQKRLLITSTVIYGIILSPAFYYGIRWFLRIVQYYVLLNPGDKVDGGIIYVKMAISISPIVAGVVLYFVSKGKTARVIGIVLTMIGLIISAKLLLGLASRG